MSETHNNADAEQLALFEAADQEVAGGASFLSAAEARANVPPGWRALVEPVASAAELGDLLILRCERRGAVLALEVASSEDPTERLDTLIGRITRAARTLCICCGRLGTPCRPIPAEPACVACEECRSRLADGEYVFAIADDYYRLDGRRRDRARPEKTVATDLRAKSTVGSRLPSNELRGLYASIRDHMRSRIVGHDELVGRLALFGASHVGGGLERGPRALLIGRSGSGKTILVEALCEALADAGMAIPLVVIDGINVGSPGWSGPPSINQLIHDALAGADPTSAWARHAIVAVDEIHHVGTGGSQGLTGNMAAKRAEVIASLLPVVGFGNLRLGEGTTVWSSQHALVLGMGAFTGLLDHRRVPTTEDLVRAGLPLEFASRFEEVLLVAAPSRDALVQILHRWPALGSLIELCRSLGYEVAIHEEAVRMAAAAAYEARHGATPRTAGGWLVAALRDRLIAALDEADQNRLEITPDSIVMPRPAAAPRGDDGPEDPGWDATLVLTRR